MKVSKQNLGVLLIVLFASLSVATGELLASSSYDPPLVNWAAPATYTLPRSGSGLHLMAGELGGGPMPFFPVTPCRQYDSRNSTPLASGVNRTVTLTGAPCGVPSLTLAVSVNITIFNITGAGSNGVFKVDTVSPPAFAWINYPPTETQRGNAGVVPLTSGGAIIVQAAQGAGQIDFTVDINGYYNNGTAGQLLPANDYFGIVGPYGLGGGVLFAENTQATGVAYSLNTFNHSTGNGSAGVNGFSAAGSGQTYGVKGQSLSTTLGAAGIYGTDTTGGTGSLDGFSFATAGIYASTNGTSTYGMLALSKGIGIKGVKQDSAGVQQTAGYVGSSSTDAFFGSGNLTITGTKSFVDPHPMSASKAIAYVSLEGPEAGTYFRGRGVIRAGRGIIEVPESFRMVTDEEGMTVQVTPIGQAITIAVTAVDLNHIQLSASKDVAFFYFVNGVRRAFKDYNPIVENEYFRPESPTATMPGAYSAEQKRLLVQNGTYNADGTPNMDTAEQMGWAKRWADAAAEARAAAAKAAQAAKEAAPNRTPNP